MCYYYFNCLTNEYYLLNFYFLYILSFPVSVLSLQRFVVMNVLQHTQLFYHFVLNFEQI